MAPQVTLALPAKKAMSVTKETLEHPARLAPPARTAKTVWMVAATGVQDSTGSLEPQAKTATTGAMGAMASTAPADTKATRATLVIKALQASKASVAPRATKATPAHTVLRDLRVYQVHAVRLAPTAKMDSR